MQWPLFAFNRKAEVDHEPQKTKQAGSQKSSTFTRMTQSTITNVFPSTFSHALIIVTEHNATPTDRSTTQVLQSNPQQPRYSGSTLGDISGARRSNRGQQSTGSQYHQHIIGDKSSRNSRVQDAAKHTDPIDTYRSRPETLSKMIERSHESWMFRCQGSNPRRRADPGW